MFIFRKYSFTVKHHTPDLSCVPMVVYSQRLSRMPIRPRFLHAIPLALLFWGAAPVRAQDAPADSAPVRVYIDCNRCDYNHIRREITIVDYVRDPKQADVHVFITDVPTGLSGREFKLSFLGHGIFERVDYSFSRTIDRNATFNEYREIINEAIRLGLVPYVVQTAEASNLTISYENGALDSDTLQSQDDPWKHWVFTLYGGSFELDLESNRTVFDSRWGFYADHRSEDWKVRIRPYFNYDLVKIRRQGRPNVRSSISRHGLDTYAIRSLGPHWSAGIFGTYQTRNDRNIKHHAELTPGIEFSVLPYEEATRRAITFVYQIGLIYVDYFEKTIFDQTEEWLPRHELEASVAIRQPWGTIYGGLEGSHYFHDAAKRRAEFFGSVSVRVFEGLSVRFQGEFEMIQDQLSLPLGDATLEEILLQQRELATDFTLSGSISMSYTFGSRFANIVNTRF